MMSKKKPFTFAITERQKGAIKRFSGFYGISEGAIIRMLISKVLDGTCDEVNDPTECCRCQFIMGCETISEIDSDSETESAEAVGVINEDSVD